MQERYYEEKYSPPVARLILAIRFHRLFSSTLFLVPSAVFFLNLSVCAADRIVKRAQRGAPRRYGPDLIHIGVLLLMIGGIMRLTGRQEDYIRLSEGESALLPSGHRILLTSLVRNSYPDGRPREYVSRVQVFKEGSIEKTEEIRVNRPLSVGGLKVYQDSFTVVPMLLLLDERHTEYHIRQGEYFRIRDTFFSFKGIMPDGGLQSSSSDRGQGQKDRSLLAMMEPTQEGITDKGEDKESERVSSDSTVFLIQEYDREGNPVGMRLLSPSDRINGYTIDSVILTEVTGLRVVQDRSFVLALVGFSIIGCGLALSFIQKRGDETT
jgi:hypothetical protein